MTGQPPLPSDPSSTAPAPSVLSAETARIEGRVVPLWRDYLELTKPEISFLVAISALAGFLLGSPVTVDWVSLVALLVGVTLTAAGSGALNHYYERELDRKMKRTAQRPLPSGRLAPAHARAFGVGLVMAGVGLLCPLTNGLTGVLASLTVVLYLFVYTPLKRRTKWNTLIGTVPGALPALGGFTAATGTFGAGGWIMFGVLAAWQMPHFFALAWMYRKDYDRAAHLMLPVVEPDGTSTVQQTVGFTVLLVVLSVLPTVLGLTSWLYLAGALGLGLMFLIPTVAFARSRSNADAKRVLMASIRYIPLLVLLLALDRLV